MTIELRLAIAFALACGLAFAATPYAIALADRLQFYDKPIGYKGHLRPTPYLGGAVVMAGFVAAVGIVAGHWGKTAPLLGGAALLWVVGTIDDRRDVSPILRAGIEVALGVVVWAAGLGWHLHAGAIVDLTLTCAWVLGVVNAFNLFDNMDGAAATMAFVVSAGAALVGVVAGDVWLAVGAASLCGACLGFLPRNVSVPARIFLGDGGSMPMGFAVAVLVMVAAGTSSVAWRSLLVALLLVGIPVLDTTLVIVSRRRRGVSVLAGGRDHLTHRARKLLPTPRAVALTLGAIQAALSVVAVLASRGEASLVVLSASLYLLAAGGAIVLLDTQQLEALAPYEGERERASTFSGGRGRALLALVGLGAGLSPFFFAYYSPSVWVPIGLGVTLASAIAIVVRPRRPGAPAALALGGLLGLGVFSLLSASWSESVESAIVSSNRWLAYGALLLLLFALVREERRAAVLMGAVAVGIVTVAVSVLVRLLGSDPASLFLGGRLNSPLGYVNGEGCLLAMGLWPCMALAETRRALLAAVGAGLTTLLACLALLTQSRGTALAILASLLFVVLFVPNRTRRIYAAMLVGGAVALAGHDLLAIYRNSAGGSVSTSLAHAAGRATLLAALLAGCAWGALTFLWGRLGVRERKPRLARAGSWLLAAPVVAVLALVTVSSQRIEHDVSRQWRAFVHLAEPGDSRTPSTPSETRLLTGGGNRYDYWRIAWHEFSANPVSGVGAGNYARAYYEKRATAEDIDQPHSLELQLLSELGLPGMALICCLIAGTLWGAVRLRRAATHSPLKLALLTSALGTFIAWLTQASVDWMELLPGLTAVALAAAAILIRPTRRRRPNAPLATSLPRQRAQAAVAVGVSAVIVTLLASGASLSRQGLADVYRSRAEHELQRNPASALSDANRSLGFDADATRTYYIKAAALARFDQARAAEAALTQALAREPRNFVTWALLGDLANREQRLTIARNDYRTAHMLNPRELTLAELARNPVASPR